jgi:PIN domain nuclease of toxin-antitoxin system
MKYLIDSHILIWMLEGSSKIPNHLKDIILNDDHEICVSTASLWEISIKVGLGKLKLKQSLNVFLDTVYTGDFTVVTLESDY